MCYVCINSVFVWPGTSKTMRYNACAVPFAGFYNIKEEKELNYSIIIVFNQIEAYVCSFFAKYLLNSQS